MESQLELIKEYFNDPETNQSIEDILEQYLNNATCEFTPYQKSVYPICAAFYMVLENREKETEKQRNKQKSPQTPQQSEAKYSSSCILDESINNKENISLQQKAQKLAEEDQSNSSCSSPSDKQKKENTAKKLINVSVIELRNKFYSKGQVEQLLKTMAEFSQVLKDREYYEVIQSKLESIKRNYSLFVKFTHVLDCFYTETELLQKHYMQRIIWRLYLLLKEQLLKQNSEVDIEQCVYLLHFICSETLRYAGKTAQSLNNNIQYYTNSSGLQNSAQQSSNLKQYANFSTISEQVNAILLKSKLETSVMQEQRDLFISLLVNIFEKIYKVKQNEESSQQNHLTENKANRNLNNSNSSSSSDTSCLTEAKEKGSNSASNIDEERDSELANTATKNSQQVSSQITDSSNALILDSFQSSQSLEKLSKLLEKEIKQYPIIEEHEFLQKEEEFIQSIQTPKAKHISSMHLQQGPPGVTKDYQECKYQISNQNHTNTSYFKKTLFNNDEQNLNLNSKLSDFERPSSPVGNHCIQQNQAGLFADAGQNTYPTTPKAPHEVYKMPYQRNHHHTSAHGIQSTPLSNALDNLKWINMYSKSDPTKRIEDLMNKINKEYKSKLIEEVSQVARDVYYTVKKKNEIGATDGIEYKVSKVVSFFQNVLEKMISDEEQKNSCKETVLISLLENKSFIFSLLANCIMTHCFVKDIKGITLDMVIKQSRITSLDYWRVISNFAKFDRHMPESIKEQLFNQEKQILLYFIWEEKDRLMQTALKNFQQEQNKDQSYEKVICKRLISHSATRVKEISKILELDEKIQERIWEALLYVYRSQLQLMDGRYVDQIIICSIYALKLIRADLFGGKEIKFKGMLSACENLLYFNSEKVKKTTDDKGESLDIINFYNKIYLNPMKPYFKSSNNNQIDIKEQINTNSMLNAPLRFSIPPNFINYTPILKEDMRVTLTPMTPVTQKLQATESMESPFVNQYNFLKQQQFLQNPKNAINRMNPLNNQKAEIPKQATQTLTVLGQSYISVQSENINGGDEKKIKDGAQGSKVFQNFNNQSFIGGTPTLEPSDSNTSPKFGSGSNSSNFFNQNKKFLEDNIEEVNNQNAPSQLKRCNSIFGPKTLNLNSDEEIPSKLSKTNNNSEISIKNTGNKEDN